MRSAPVISSVCNLIAFQQGEFLFANFARIIGYIYTAMYNQNQSGAPAINQLFFAYPSDANLYGNSILVSPVSDEKSTTTSIYLPKDIFHDFWIHEVVQGLGDFVTLSNVFYTTIPLHYKGGSVAPLRTNSANDH